MRGALLCGVRAEVVALSSFDSHKKHQIVLNKTFLSPQFTLWRQFGEKLFFSTRLKMKISSLSFLPRKPSAAVDESALIVIVVVVSRGKFLQLFHAQFHPKKKVVRREGGKSVDDDEEKLLPHKKFMNSFLLVNARNLFMSKNKHENLLQRKKKLKNIEISYRLVGWLWVEESVAHTKINFKHTKWKANIYGGETRLLSCVHYPPSQREILAQRAAEAETPNIIISTKYL